MFQSNLLENKRILITGGGTGLGKAAAHRFLELGATVYICGRRPEVLAATVAELRQASGGAAHSLVCDVRDAARVAEMIATIWRDGALDGLMNNAAGNFLARTEDLSLRAFEAVLGIVLQGSLHTTLACGGPQGGGVEHNDHVHNDGVGLRGSVGGGQGRGTGAHAQPGGGVGEPGDPHERDRSRADPD